MSKNSLKVTVRPALYSTDRAKGRQFPVLKSTGTLGTEELIDWMSGDGGSVSRAQAAACLERLSSLVSACLMQGKNVSIKQIGTLKLHACGMLESDNTPVKGHPVTFELGLLPAPALKRALRRVKYEVVTSSQRMPRLRTLLEATTLTGVQKLKAGGHYRLTGNCLGFDDTAADEGLYLIAPNKHEAKIESLIAIENKHLIFQMPTGLAKGHYVLQVRRRFPRSDSLRCGELDCSI